MLAEQYAAEVLEFQPAIRRNIDWGVTGFWIWALALLLIGLLKWASGREARRTREEEKVEQKRQIADSEQKMSALQRSANTIASLIVPADMLRTFSFTHDAIHRVFAEAFAAERLGNSGGIPAEDMVELFRGHVRIVLMNILEMIAEIEPTGPGTVYAANVMRFYRESRLDGERGPRRKEVQARLAFCSGKKSIAKSVMGVLDLDPELSTSTAACGQPDPFLTRFALLVPLYQKN